VTIEELAKSEGIWNSVEQNNTDLVLKSSVRFSRNLPGYSFSHKLKAQEKTTISKLLIDMIQLRPYCANCDIYHFKDVASTDRKIFFERNIIGDDNVSDSVLMLSENQNLYFILNSADHLQLITSWPGYQFDSAYDLGRKIITDFEGDLDFAFSPRCGYLTADPHRSGTGLTLSVIFHLAGLIHSGRINELMMELDQNDMVLRGSWIDGYCEIFNRKSIGKSEEELCDATLGSFENIIQKERQFRTESYERNRSFIEDKVWRSYGILLSCRTISLFEALELLSNLRLGISLDVINYVQIREINLLIHFIQDYHLRKRYNIIDDEIDLDEMRALFIRDFLKEVI
jgi:protein arginine kinase